jgi:CheY-like chemotaxis protein
MSDTKTILIVDDDATLVESTKDLLEAHGYNVICAYEGESGIELAKEEKPDLMILDVMMATKTQGFEVARKVPETPELKDLPVLLVTGVREKMRLGYQFQPDETWLPVERVLEKPVEPARLLATIAKLLAEK